MRYFMVLIVFLLSMNGWAQNAKKQLIDAAIREYTFLNDGDVSSFKKISFVNIRTEENKATNFDGHLPGMVYFINDNAVEASYYLEYTGNSYQAQHCDCCHLMVDLDMANNLTIHCEDVCTKRPDLNAISVLYKAYQNPSTADWKSLSNLYGAHQEHDHDH